MSSRRKPAHHGVLLVDKSKGGTSHDVVSLARRAFGQREVGHAGTLDPMATGLLVLLLGEATKLSPYLTADSKRYLATVRFGTSTDTLDADGEIVATVVPPRLERDLLAREVAAMIGPTEQVPPAVSAIKQRGVALHERVRRGETVIVAPRSVVLEHAEVNAVYGAECDIAITCSKGFYVRSFARDLAERLGTLGHLSALRRVSSGGLDVADALPEKALADASTARSPGSILSQVRPIAQVGPPLVRVEISSDDSRALEQGKTVATLEGDGVVLVVRLGDDVPICIGEVTSGVLRVRRGMRFG